MESKKKMVRMNLLESNNRDTDAESKRVDTEGKKGGWDELEDWN